MCEIARFAGFEVAALRALFAGEHKEATSKLNSEIIALRVAGIPTPATKRAHGTRGKLRQITSNYMPPWIKKNSFSACDKLLQLSTRWTLLNNDKETVWSWKFLYYVPNLHYYRCVYLYVYARILLEIMLYVLFY